MRKTIKVNITILLILALFMPHLSVATEVKLYTTEEPPMNFTKNKKVTGIVTDIVREIQKRTGIYGEIVSHPWARSYKTALNNSNSIVFTASKSPDREVNFEFIGPVIAKRWVLLGKTSETSKFDSLEQAKNLKKIGILRKDARATFLIKQGFTNIYETDSHIQALTLLEHGRIDAIATSDIEFPLLIKESGFNPESYQIIFPFKTIFSYILINKKSGKDIIKKWRDAYVQITEDGTLQSLAKMWSKKISLPLKADKGYYEYSGKKQKALPSL